LPPFFTHPNGTEGLGGSLIVCQAIGVIFGAASRRRTLA
jgi:hypothetical protein